MEGILKNSSGNCYPTSSVQKRIYVLSRLNNIGTSYNMPAALLFEGDIDTDRVKNALNGLIKRHESLRTSFELDEYELVQVVHTEMDLNISFISIYDCSLNVESCIRQILQQFIQPFDLFKAPLFRVKLVKFSDGRHVLIFDIHHIISDGLSMNILINDFIELYRMVSLPELKIQYKDYAIWENEFLMSDSFKKHEEFWLEVFSGEIPLLNLHTDYKRPAIQEYEGERIAFGINNDLFDNIYRLASETGTTLFMVFLAVYYLLMYKYTGQKDIVIATPVAGRSYMYMENIIGMFVNMLPIRNRLDEGKTFREFLEEVKDSSIKAYENQNYQYAYMLNKLKYRRVPGRNPLFDAVLTIEYPEEIDLNIEDIKIIPLEIEHNIARFDINIIIPIARGSFNIIIEYPSSLFKRSSIERLGERYIEILNLVIYNKDIVISDINFKSNFSKADAVILENMDQDFDFMEV